VLVDVPGENLPEDLKSVLLNKTAPQLPEPFRVRFGTLQSVIAAY